MAARKQTSARKKTQAPAPEHEADAAAPAEQTTSEKKRPEKKRPEKKRPPEPKPEKGKHEKGKHLRRAYEHLGRVEGLKSLEAIASAPSIALLLREGQRRMETGDSRHAAELLRAAEHLGFAALAAHAGAPADVSPELEQALRREFEKKVEKAGKHAPSKRSALGKLAHESLASAHAAVGKKSFREALELVRAVEALSEAGAEGEDKSS